MVALSGEACRAEAQYVAVRRFAVAPATATVVPQPFAPARPRAWPYVVTGAVVGGLAMGVGLAVYFENTNEEFLGSPFGLLPAVAGAAAVGGGVGYLVYRVRF